MVMIGKIISLAYDKKGLCKLQTGATHRGIFVKALLAHAKLFVDVVQAAVVPVRAIHAIDWFTQHDYDLHRGLYRPNDSRQNHILIPLAPVMHHYMTVRVTHLMKSTANMLQHMQEISAVC